MQQSHSEDPEPALAPLGTIHGTLAMPSIVFQPWIILVVVAIALWYFLRMKR